MENSKDYNIEKKEFDSKFLSEYTGIYAKPLKEMKKEIPDVEDNFDLIYLIEQAS